MPSKYEDSVAYIKVWLRQVSLSQPSCMEVVCTEYQCLLEETAMQQLQEGNEHSLYSWKPANTSQFWGISLEDGIKERLGAEKPDVPAALKVSVKCVVQTLQFIH